jgi:glycosyltransferase involved in cell wall biosynthesis
MTFSICIPTYSRLNYLKESVNAILEQTFKNYEICVSIDPKPDGPDNEIIKWCFRMSKMYSFFRFKVNDKNKGLAGNWNELIDMALAEYVSIIGDDDILRPTFLEEISKRIMYNKADVIFTNQHFINYKGEIDYEYTETANTEYARKKLEDGFIKDPIISIFNNSVPMSACVIKRNYFKTIKFDDKLNTPELEVFLKIAIMGGSFEYVNQQLAEYRFHNESATSSGLKINFLISNLIDIHVPTIYEYAKIKFISERIATAVNHSIKQNNLELANRLFASKYYTNIKLHYRIVHYILLHLPNNFIRFFSEIKDNIK